MTTTRTLASAAVGSFLVVALSTVVSAQGPARPFSFPVSRQASSAPGSIGGTVVDERGLPVANVVVSVLGAATTVAVTDAEGRFECGMLAPGPYLVRAHHNGFTAPRAQLVQVNPSARAGASIALRREGAAPVLAAGLGVAGLVGQPIAPPEAPPASTADSTDQDEPSRTAWRIRHGRRGVLKDVTLPGELLAMADDGAEDLFAPVSRAFEASPRAAMSLFADAAFTGQVNLLTSGSFDTPRQLFSSGGMSHSIANVRLGAPAGANADWSVAGALTQSDMASWVVAGSYSLRAPARHRYDLGVSYSTQQYGGGNPLALRGLTDGSRNVGTAYAYDSFTISPSATLTFGTEFGRYDYLADRVLLSPRVELTLTPESNARFTASVSQRSLAPGAEEFLPPSDAGIWLPPQRTFSSLDRDGAFRAERAMTARAKLERDYGPITVAAGGFAQHVSNQLVTVFGGELPGQPAAKLGHYMVGNGGDVDLRGYSAEFRALIASRVHGSVEYSFANGRIVPSGNSYLMLLAPMTAGLSSRSFHDLSARLDAEVPETATRVLVVYRFSTGFAAPAGAEGQTPLMGRRFDVQVRQSLPFMNFSSARWEMLLAVRNFFRDVTADQSLFDELLVVRPPKRLVGGVTLHF